MGALPHDRGWSGPAVFFEYEKLAKVRLTRMAFDYYAGGAADGITARANHRAYDEIFLRYRILAGGGRATGVGCAQGECCQVSATRSATPARPARVPTRASRH